MKKLSIFILSLIMISLGVYMYIESKMASLEKKVTEYLLNEKGYHESDLTSVKSSFGKLPPFSVSVTFNDEPNIIYMYKEDNGQIIQYTYSPISEEQRNSSQSIEDELLHKE